MRISNISERFILYVTEQSVLISLTSLISLSMNIKAAFLGFLVAYNSEFTVGLEHLFDTTYGWINILILFLVSLTYYMLETLSGRGIGPTVFKLRVISKYQIPETSFIKLQLLRDVIRAFFIVNIVNAVFALKNRKSIQGLFDSRAGLLTVRDSNDSRKDLFLLFLYSSLIIYYSSFIILLLTFTFVVSPPSSPASTVAAHGTYNFWIFFSEVFRNNFSLDFLRYMLGGFSLFIGTFIALFSSNTLEVLLMSSLNQQHGVSSFVKYILPQFFPETFGYVFGLSVALVITDLILILLQSIIRNERSSVFKKRANNAFFLLGVYSVLSISLLLVGALVEASLGISGL